MVTESADSMKSRNEKSISLYKSSDRQDTRVAFPLFWYTGTVFTEQR